MMVAMGGLAVMVTPGILALCCWRWRRSWVARKVQRRVWTANDVRGEVARVQHGLKLLRTGHPCVWVRTAGGDWIRYRRHDYGKLISRKLAMQSRLRSLEKDPADVRSAERV